MWINAHLGFQQGIRPLNGLERRLHVDPPLLLSLLIVSAIGMAVLYSAEERDTDIVLRQGLRLGIGFAVMLSVARVSPAALRRGAPWAYAAGIVLLIMVLVMGESGKGAQRWLELGVIRFQPSEIVKVAVPMMVAWYLSDRHLPPNLGCVLLAAFIIGVPVVLVARQPDMGTALIIGNAGFFALFFAGLKMRLILTITGVGASLAPLLWYGMHDYQRQRLLTFLNPESDPLGAGYHIIQSKIAIGSGGLLGKGWQNGTQSHLDFLPERSTDFIFSVFGEEFGLIGAILLLALYILIVIRGLVISTRAQDTFSRVLAGSLVLTVFVYVFVNMGMASGLLPVVGLPLPLMSYGGTSLVTLMAGFGMLMSIHTHRKLLPT
jgi:rod shape-determining protein RodA